MAGSLRGRLNVIYDHTTIIVAILFKQYYTTSSTSTQDRNILNRQYRSPSNSTIRIRIKTVGMYYIY